MSEYRIYSVELVEELVVEVERLTAEKSRAWYNHELVVDQLLDAEQRIAKLEAIVGYVKNGRNVTARMMIDDLYAATDKENTDG